MMKANEGNVEVIRSATMKWVNVEKPTQKEVDFLAQNFFFHPLALEDCVTKLQMTKLDKYDDYLFIVLHFPTKLEHEPMIQRSQLSIFLGKDYLVTVHQGDIKLLSEMFQRCKSDEKACEALLLRSPGYALYKIIDRLVDALFPLLDEIMRELDEIEDKVFDERVEAAREVSVLRRKVADIRRIVLPLKRVIYEVSKETSRYTAEDLSAYFDDVQDHLDKVWENLSECKETIEIYKDTDFMLSSERTNKILAILTILFTLSIPATVVGTFYGMNVPLPGGLESGPWTFFGPYTTFMVLLLASAVAALVMLFYFRKIGWL